MPTGPTRIPNKNGIRQPHDCMSADDNWDVSPTPNADASNVLSP